MLKIYYLFDNKAHELSNCFISASDETALRILKNDIYQLTLKRNSLVLSQLSDCTLFKFEKVEQKGLDDAYRSVKVVDLKGLISFNLDIQLKSEQAKLKPDEQKN